MKETEAQITKITKETNITTVEIEWGGPNDHAVTDFDLSTLGKVFRHGGDLRSGWVVLDGDCLLKEGDTIPLTEGE